MKTLNDIKEIVIKDFEGREKYRFSHIEQLPGFDYATGCYIADNGDKIHGVRIFPPTKKGLWVCAPMFGYNAQCEAFLSNKVLRIVYK